MREPAPPNPDIPGILIAQSIVVKYAEEYIIVEPIDSRRILARMLLEAVELGAR